MPIDLALPPPVVFNEGQEGRTALIAGTLTIPADLPVVGLSFAAVPLYDLFCRMTGFGGTPMIGLAAPLRIPSEIHSFTRSMSLSKLSCAAT